MSIVIREQDILKSPPPPIEGCWTEASIRSYQEAHGINYGNTVFERGSKPYREWSNDRYFGGQKESQVVDPRDEEIEKLRKQIEELQSKEEEPVVHTGVDRHGLVPSSDKRTRAYKQSMGL